MSKRRTAVTCTTCGCLSSPIVIGPILIVTWPVLFGPPHDLRDTTTRMRPVRFPSVEYLVYELDEPAQPSANTPTTDARSRSGGATRISCHFSRAPPARWRWVATVVP